MRRLHHRRGSTRIVSAPGGLLSIFGVGFAGVSLAGAGVMFVGIAANTPILHSFYGTGALLGAVGLGMCALAVWMWLRRANAQRLRESGVEGQARIVGMTQTNMYVNYQPVVELSLEVMTATGPGYSVTRRETVPQIMLGRLGHGAILPVKVDPTNPQNFIIVWDA